MDVNVKIAPLPVVNAGQQGQGYVSAEQAEMEARRKRRKTRRRR